MLVMATGHVMIENREWRKCVPPAAVVQVIFLLQVIILCEKGAHMHTICTCLEILELEKGVRLAA